jgi:hypothetical protein
VIRVHYVPLPVNQDSIAERAVEAEASERDGSSGEEGEVIVEASLGVAAREIPFKDGSVTVDVPL